MKKARLIFGLCIGLFVMFTTGCQDAESDQAGNLVIKLTDAPFPIDMIDAATVTITKVEIRIRSEGDELEYPFITLLDEPLEFNLLELRNGITAELLDLEIEPGNYNLIRLFVDEASLLVKGGETYDIKVPSGEQSGIKIFIDPSLRVAGGLTTEVLLDFDVEKSFLVNGNPDTPAGIKGFHFKPVIRAVNNATAGMVEGVVTDIDEVLMQDVSVWIEEADTVVTSAFTDADGYYAMPGIPAGFYSLLAASEGYDTVTYTDVEIVEGNQTVQNFTLVLTP